MSHPIGYDIVKSNGKRSIVLNKDGRLLKKAFHWKVKEKISSEEIIRRLAAQGLKITNQRISAFFRNPFYCGLMVHTALEGQIIEGNHEKMISKSCSLKLMTFYLKISKAIAPTLKMTKYRLNGFISAMSVGSFLGHTRLTRIRSIITNATRKVSTAI